LLDKDLGLLANNAGLWIAAIRPDISIIRNCRKTDQDSKIIRTFFLIRKTLFRKACFACIHPYMYYAYKYYHLCHQLLLALRYLLSLISVLCQRFFWSNCNDELTCILASNTSTYLMIPSIVLHQSRHSFTCIFSHETFEAEINLQEERTHFRLLVKAYIINSGRLIFGVINI
jgi:hypothetical protein